MTKTKEKGTRKVQAPKPSPHTLTITHSKGKAFGWCGCGAYLGKTIREGDDEAAREAQRQEIAAKHGAHVQAMAAETKAQDKMVVSPAKEKAPRKRAQPKQQAKEKDKSQKVKTQPKRKGR